MYVKVEPTGVCERKGLVQIRFCMYLEEGDYGYDKHHIQVAIIPPEGYLGETEVITFETLDKWKEEGKIYYTLNILDEGFLVPVDMDNYQVWYENLSKVWQNNPFHNHFIYVEPEITDEKIMDIGQAFLEEAYVKWACDRERDLKNSKVEYPASFDLAKVEAKVQHLKSTTLERKV